MITTVWRRWVFTIVFGCLLVFSGLYGCAEEHMTANETDAEERIAPSPRAALAARADLFRRVQAKDEKALAHWERLSSPEKIKTLSEASQSGLLARRLAAIQELQSISPSVDGGKEILRALVEAALAGGEAQVRESAQKGFSAFDRREAAERVFERMERGDAVERERAAGVLRGLGGLEPVAVIVEHWRESWGPGPREHAVFARQQSYIADYQISGDSWDPVIGQFLTGVVLDVKPLVAFADHYIVKVLRGLTGQNFGLDREAWARWLQARKIQAARDKGPDAELIAPRDAGSERP
jgi:hypothetical protein